MPRKRTVGYLALAFGLGIGTPAIAQHGAHTTPPVNRAGSPGIAAERDVNGLLEAAGEAVRRMERALAERDGATLESAAGEFVTIAEALEEAFAGMGPGLSRDARQAQKAFGRHLRRLTELSGRGSAAEGEAIGAALEAGEKARDTAAAASDPAPGHHGASRRRGCGHH